MSQGGAPSSPVFRALRAIAQAEVVFDQRTSAVIDQMEKRDTLRRQDAQTERARVEGHLKQAQRNLQRVRVALADTELGIVLPVHHAPEEPESAATEKRSLEEITAAGEVEACRVEAGLALLKALRRRRRFDNLSSLSLADRRRLDAPRPLLGADNRLALAWRTLASDDLAVVARVKEIVDEAQELLDATANELREAYDAERAELEGDEQEIREGSFRFGLLFALYSGVALWVLLLPLTAWFLDLGSPYSTKRLARLVPLTTVLSLFWGAGLATFYRAFQLRRIRERIAQIEQGIWTLKNEPLAQKPVVPSGIRLFSPRAFRRMAAVGFGVGVLLTTTLTSISMSRATPRATLCDVEGVWDLVEMKVDDVDVSSRWQSRKVLADGKWELASTPIGVAAGAGEVQVLSGSGTYSINDTTYVERVTRFHDPRMVGVSNAFTCQIIGDYWYSEGTLRYLSDPSRSYNLYEVWKRAGE